MGGNEQSGRTTNPRSRLRMYTPAPVGGEGREFHQKPYQFEKGGGGVTPSPTPAPVGGESGGEWGGVLFWGKFLVF